LAGLSLSSRADARMSTNDPFLPLAGGSYRVVRIAVRLVKRSRNYLVAKRDVHCRKRQDNRAYNEDNKSLPSDNPRVLLTGKLRIDGTIFAIFLEPPSDPEANRH
jgi:hypothetical protein